MKKYLWIFIFFILIIVVTVFAFNKNNDSNKEKGYTAEKMSIENNQVENLILEEGTTKNNSIQDEISKFSTKLPKDTKARYSNIKLACETLNGSIVKKGETFSLWDVLGCPTKEKGYKKAKTFTAEGKIIKSYGGGICQVSTTIYNAVLATEGLKIEERHEHSRDVVYIDKGKDAAVSYNSADLKFKNTLDYDIKIEAKVENNKVKIKLVRI